MALLSLLRAGIERCAEAEQSEFIEGTVNATDAEARAALNSMRMLPDALQALCELEWADDVPLLLRSLLPVVTTYLLREDDLVPTQTGQILAGSLDDAYIAFSACGYADSHLDHNRLSKFEEHREAVSALLSSDVIAELDQELEGALSDAAQFIDSAHLEGA